MYVCMYVCMYVSDLTLAGRFELLANYWVENTIEIVFQIRLQLVRARTQGDVTILWCPDVDCQWDKGHFTFGVQGNGMG